MILVTVYWINRAVGLLQSVLGDGQSLGMFVQLSLLTIPSVVELIVPMAAFGAAVFTANKLMGDSELVILQATGFSYARLLRPVIFFGLAVAVFTAIVTNFLIPAAAKQLRELRFEMAQNSTAKYLKSGQFHRPNDQVVLYFREMSDNGEILDIFIADYRNPINTQIYTAQRALVVEGEDDPKLLMLEGVLQRKNVLSGVISTSHFTDFTVSLASLIDQTDTSKRSISELSTWSLITATQTVADTFTKSAANLHYDGHLRLTWPISTAFTGLIGFASLLLGAFSRNGLLTQIGMGITLLIALYLIHIITLSTGTKIDSGWIFAYATPLFGMIVTLTLIWAAGKPRKISGNRARIEQASMP